MSCLARRTAGARSSSGMLQPQHLLKVCLKLSTQQDVLTPVCQPCTRKGRTLGVEPVEQRVQGRSGRVAAPGCARHDEVRRQLPLQLLLLRRAEWRRAAALRHQGAGRIDQGCNVRSCDPSTALRACVVEPQCKVQHHQYFDRAQYTESARLKRVGAQLHANQRAAVARRRGSRPRQQPVAVPLPVKAQRRLRG